VARQQERTTREAARYAACPAAPRTNSTPLYAADAQAQNGASGFSFCVTRHGMLSTALHAAAAACATLRYQRRQTPQARRAAVLMPRHSAACRQSLRRVAASSKGTQDKPSRQHARAAVRSVYARYSAKCAGK